MSEKPKNRKPELVAALKQIRELAEKAENIGFDLDEDYTDEVWAHAGKEAVEQMSLTFDIDHKGQLVIEAYDEASEAKRVVPACLWATVSIFVDGHSVEHFPEQHRLIRDQLEKALSYLPPAEALPPPPAKTESEDLKMFVPVPREPGEREEEYALRMSRLKRAQALARKWEAER